MPLPVILEGSCPTKRFCTPLSSSGPRLCDFTGPLGGLDVNIMEEIQKVSVGEKAVNREGWVSFFLIQN